MKKLLPYLLAVNTAFACPVDSVDITAELYSPMNEHKSFGITAGVSESDFKDLVGKFETHFSPLYKAQGLDLMVLGDWLAPSINASSTVSGTTAIIKIAGGLARAPEFQKDGVVLALCHEVGHHLGGFPKIPATPWASAEGQADYYATLKCMKDFYKNDPDNTLIESVFPKNKTRKACDSTYSDRDSFQICLRSTFAAERVNKIFFKLWKMPEDPFYGMDTKDFKRVSETEVLYPDPQCRLDSTVAGALCNVGVDVLTNNLDERVGVCHKANGQKVGLRPECWFKPRTKF